MVSTPPLGFLNPELRSSTSCHKLGWICLLNAICLRTPALHWSRLGTQMHLQFMELFLLLNSMQITWWSRMYMSYLVWAASCPFPQIWPRRSTEIDDITEEGIQSWAVKPSWYILSKVSAALRIWSSARNESDVTWANFGSFFSLPDHQLWLYYLVFREWVERLILKGRK